MIKKFLTKFFVKEYIYTRVNSYYFLSIIRRYKDISIYLNLFSSSTASRKIFSNKEIYYNDKLKFLSTIRSAKRIVPTKVLIRKTFSDYTILLFKTTIGGYSTKLMMHFYKNSLFLYNYTFTNLSKKDKELIKRIIQEKYLVDKLNFDTTSQVIIDHDNTVISIKDTMYFTVNYISLKHPFFNFLKKTKMKIEKDEAKKEQQKKEELFDKL